MTDMEPAPDSAEAALRLRLDKWLVHARFCKTRGVAAALIGSKRLRVDGVPVAKAHFALRPGMVLTFPQGPDIRVVRVEALGARRGPATEARTLYTDLAPPSAPALVPTPPLPAVRRDAGAGRPTKRDRRATDRLRTGHAGPGDAADEV